MEPAGKMQSLHCTCEIGVFLPGVLYPRMANGFPIRSLKSKQLFFEVTALPGISG